MTIYDLSLTISNTLPVWPGDPAVNLYRVMDMSRGDPYTVSRMECGVHTGTHLDAPMHFLRDGRGAETLDLNVLVGACQVVYIPQATTIDARLLQSLDIPATTTRILFRTRNSELWARGETAFQTEFVAIEASGAEWLVEHGVRLVGVDYLSVAPFTASVPTHEILLRAGVIPIEGLNLANIEPGDYQLICLPLKLLNSDGAPVRAILVRE